MSNEFDTDVKYRLYRTISEILAPTISKKNISNYKILIDDNLLPIRVFYPRSVSKLDKVIIFIHGDGEVTSCFSKYGEICKNMALYTERLVIAIDYNKIKHGYMQMINEVIDTVVFLYDELEKNGILRDDICLVGDSTASFIITSINKSNRVNVFKEILFYPIIDNYLMINDNNSFIKKVKDYYSYIAYKKDMKDDCFNVLEDDNYKCSCKSMIVVGSMDSVASSCCLYYNKIGDKKNSLLKFDFLSHGFLKDMESDMYLEINKFLD